MKTKLLLFYIFPFFASCMNAQIARSVSRSIVHVISCDDINDKSIGSASEKSNLFYTHSLVDSINYCTKNTAVSYSFTGERYNKNVITERLDNLKTEPEDVIVFHFSGYGFSLKNDSLPVMYIRNSSTQRLSDCALYLSDIYTLLRSKPHRLMLLFYEGSRITYDSLSVDSIPRQNIPSNVDRTFYKYKSKQDNNDNSWKTLFSLSKGNYIVYSCRYGEDSVIIPGIGDMFGYYVEKVFDELYFGKHRSWENVLTDISSRCSIMAKDTGITQHPCWSEIKPMKKE